eukprot:SAG31_NODE_4944_length_2844_cov_1.437887_3_plen_56_part_00
MIVTKTVLGGAAARLLSLLDKQIEQAESEIKATERWETVTEEYDAEVCGLAHIVI